MLNYKFCENAKTALIEASPGKIQKNPLWKDRGNLAVTQGLSLRSWVFVDKREILGKSLFLCLSLNFSPGKRETGKDIPELNGWNGLWPPFTITHDLICWSQILRMNMHLLYFHYCGRSLHMWAWSTMAMAWESVSSQCMHIQLCWGDLSKVLTHLWSCLVYAGRWKRLPGLCREMGGTSVVSLFMDVCCLNW